MPITSPSPVAMTFTRAGGSDMRCEIQVWVNKASVAPTDRPVAVIRFDQPTESKEQVDRSLAPGAYVCVVLVMVREALNGRFDYQLTVAGNAAVHKQGDVNTTAKPNDMRTFKNEFELTVSA